MCFSKPSRGSDAGQKLSVGRSGWREQAGGEGRGCTPWGGTAWWVVITCSTSVLAKGEISVILSSPGDTFQRLAHLKSFHTHLALEAMQLHLLGCQSWSILPRPVGQLSALAYLWHKHSQQELRIYSIVRLFFFLLLSRRVVKSTCRHSWAWWQFLKALFWGGYDLSPAANGKICLVLQAR